MCGHATIALGRYAVDYGLVKPVYPETSLILQCPCGSVGLKVETREGEGGRPKTGAVSFEGVPSYVVAAQQKVEVEGRGCVTYDLCYGGTFYAFVDAAAMGLDLTDARHCVDYAGDVTDQLRKTLHLSHPDSPDIAFLYGTILYRDEEEGGFCYLQCVFAERQVSQCCQQCRRKQVQP